MEPQHLAAGQGLKWIKQGWALFKKSPLLWVVLLLICFVGVIGLSVLPVVGEPLASLLLPVILAGLMSGCRALEQGDELELAHLFSGFKHRTTQLVTLGGIALVGQFLIFGVMIMVGGATLVSILMSADPPKDPEIIRQAISGASAAMLIGITLFSIIVMSMQFAPMLVFFNNLAPLAAMKLSLRAFLRNMGAISVYGIIFFMLAILASIPMMLGWFVLMPIIFTSTYAAYCDIFPPVKENREPSTENNAFAPGKDIF